MNFSFLKEEDFEKGRQLLGHHIHSCVFSERIYQIEVSQSLDTQETVWVFLGLDRANEPTDFFCECEEFEERQSCPHLAAAYLMLFDGHQKPLHIRYKHSLWYIVFFIAARRHGFHPTLSAFEKGGGFYIQSTTGKTLFSMQAKTDEGKKKLDEYVFHRPQETEENSIKFSHLSIEELNQYREGHPSIHLQFELSMWSDLSKWLMVQYAQGIAYTVEFVSENNHLPHEMKVLFPDMDFSFYIARANWKEILPFLNQIASNLHVHPFATFTLTRIHYDPAKVQFTLHKKDLHFPSNSECIDLGDWVYRLEFGFFPKHTDPLFDGDHIEKESIKEVFRKYPDLLKAHLKETVISFKEVRAHYHLFVKERALHIELYAFEKGDMKQALSAFFNPWGYIESKGFFPLKQLVFDTVEKTISKAHIAHFISHYRAWLSQFKGFETHLIAMETQMTYRILSDESLLFESIGDYGDLETDIVDFGEWLYVKGQGFFPKNKGGVSSFLQGGMHIEKKEVDHFIRSHEPELELIKGFFARRCPILKMGLKIALTEGGVIEIHPITRYATDYKEDNVTIYGEYVYAHNEGFSQIPKKAQLPVGYEIDKEIPPFLEKHFLQYEIEQLKPYIFEIDPRLSEAKDMRLLVEHIAYHSKTGTYQLSLGLKSKQGIAPFYKLYQAVVTMKPFLICNAGLIWIKEPRFDWIKELDDDKVKEQHLTVSAMEWIRACVYETVEFSPQCDPALVESLKQFNMPSWDHLDKPCLAGFKTELRPYQILGVKWLWHLYLHRLSGILSDEMGLGKTHQAMGLIAAVMNHVREDKARFFIACPTSVLYHWQRLLETFLPEANVFMYYGLSRSLNTQKEYDIFLTSYGVLRSDIREIQTMQFDVAIFDEMQSAKNKRSQIHRALKVMRANMKLGLTGTPIENDLLDLKALFDILLPRFFSSDQRFKQLFVLPSDHPEKHHRAQLLKQLIHPFILRRKKADVLQDLPEKIEEIAYIDLADEQRAIYDQVLEKGYHEIENLQASNDQQLSIHIFALLSKLKQICDHPCLLSKTPEAYRKHASGKFELCKEILREAKESNLKVVIFTQYLDMLRIFHHYLTHMHIGFASIHGGTRNRKEEVERFQNDPQCEVFVATLQAGGVGIDLISASVVIHYDRWWNPAKENQATDRVHRFGQTRGVQVFKFISKNTIEEAIDALIEKKKDLLHTVVGYDGEDQIKKLDPKELMNILRTLYEEKHPPKSR